MTRIMRCVHASLVEPQKNQNSHTSQRHKTGARVALHALKVTVGWPKGAQTLLEPGTAFAAEYPVNIIYKVGETLSSGGRWRGIVCLVTYTYWPNK